MAGILLPCGPPDRRSVLLSMQARRSYQPSMDPPEDQPNQDRDVELA